MEMKDPAYSHEVRMRQEMDTRADSLQEDLSAPGNRKDRRAALAMAKARVSVGRSGLNSF